MKDIAAFLEVRGRCSSSGPLFANADGTKMNDKTIFNIVKRWSRKAGLQQKCYSPHSFRHFAATRLLDHGVPIHSVKAMLGHESIETTDIYAHTSMRALEKALADKVPELGSERRAQGSDSQASAGPPAEPAPTTAIGDGDASAGMQAFPQLQVPFLVVPLGNGQGMSFDGASKHVRIDVKINGGAVETRVTEEPLDGEEVKTGAQE